MQKPNVSHDKQIEALFKAKILNERMNKLKYKI